MSEDRHSYLMGAIRHYRALFTFPSYSKIVCATILTILLGCIIAFAVSTSSIVKTITKVILASTTLLLPMLGMDVLMSRHIISEDPVLDLRRMAALTLATAILWMFIFDIWAASQVLIDALGPTKGFSFGASLICSFRLLVLKSVSVSTENRIGVVALLPPVLSIYLGTFWLVVPFKLLVTTILSGILLVTVACVFVSFVDRHGRLSIGLGAIELFKAFLANWLTGLVSPLEGYFEQMGKEVDISVKLLGFTRDGVPEATIVVPDVHPGPFRNLGSSNLPWEIQRAVQTRASVVVMVPHGASGHELDVTSQAHNRRILDAITKLADCQYDSTLASSMVRVNIGGASATCQFFGNVALVTITCAPASMEDIPLEIGAEIVEKGKTLGADDVVVIDSHNSIGDTRDAPVLTKTQLDDIKEAAESAIERASQTKRYPFGLGAPHIEPKEFGIVDGFGPGGIAAAVVSVDSKKMAYVVIDGNNMVTGLREKVLDSLRDIVNDAEVLTTDTHIVNAVSTIERGYRAIGESVDHQRLLSYFRECVVRANQRVATSSAGYRVGVIHRIRVIGETKLRSISLLVDSALKLSKRLVMLLYVPAVIIAILLYEIL